MRFLHATRLPSSPENALAHSRMPRTSPPRKDKNRVPRQKRELPAAAPKEAERVAKVVARAGLGSRREIEEWIEAGRVAVNGEVLTSPAVTVTAEDTITIDGEPLPERERTRLFIYHKPRGVVTTNRDPEGRTTLFEILPQGLPRLVSVGRLDLNSEGLLLLTNDGGLARVLELPETGWLRRYRVRANGEVNQAQLDALIKGITVDGVEYGPIEAELDRVQGANCWITVSLREGKNREVRNVLGALGLKVNRLIRVSYGPFQLGEIAEGAVEEVRTRVLRDQIGADLAAAAGADFEGPLVEREVEEERPRPAPRPAGRKQAAADTAGGLKKPARRSTRDEDFAAPAEDFIHPAGPRPRRRASEERDTERVGTVADRKGRAVKVERVVASKEGPARGGKPGGRGPGRRGPPELDTRPPRRDDARRSGSGEERPRRGYGDEGGFKRSGPRRDDERAQGGRAYGVRSEGRSGGYEDKPARGRARPEGRDYEDRPRRGPAGERSSGERASGDRPFRPRPEGRGGYEDKPARGRARPEGRDYEDRPRRGPAGERSSGERPSGDRPFRAGGERPAGRGFGDGGGKPGGFKAGGKPGGKPGGKFGAKPGGRPGGPAKGAPRGGKPGGGKPGGGKPGGPRGKR